MFILPEMKKLAIAFAVLFSTSFLTLSAQDTVAHSDSTKTTLLDELVVVGKTIKETPTGYKIQLSNNDIIKGKNVTETLGFLPNITVKDNTILINGKAPSKITIDGRKVRNTEELSSLPGDFLDNVEIRFIPDAGDIIKSLGGTIAIKLKKQSTSGYYGTLTGYLDAGIKAGLTREAISPVINAKTGKLNIYDWLYAGLYHSKDWATQTLESATSTTTYHERQKDINNQVQNTLNLNYEFSPRHNLALNWYYSYAKTGINDINTDTSETLLDTHAPVRQNTLSLIYSGRLNNNGDRLNASVEWLNRNVEETSEYGDNGGSLKKDYQTQTSNLMQFQTDYNRDLTSNHSISVGATYLLTKANTGSNADLTGHGLEWLEERVITQTPKVFVSMMGSIGKLNYYADLGWKHNSVKILSQKAHVQSSLEPAVRLSLPIKEEFSLSLQYAHMLGDIQYDAISDKKRWLNGLMYFTGNPDLRASNYDEISVSAGLWNNRLNLTLGYERTNNPIMWETFTEEGTNVNYTKPVNMKGVSSYQLNVDYMLKLFGWWTIRPSLRLTLLEENGTMGGKVYNGKPFRQFYAIDNSFTFKNGWGGSADFDIEPTYHFFDHTMYSVYGISCKVYKYFCNKTLRLRFDFFPLNRRRAFDRHSDQMFVHYKYTTPGQWGKLMFTWYFKGGKKDIRINRQRTSLYYRESKSD